MCGWHVIYMDGVREPMNDRWWMKKLLGKEEFVRLAHGLQKRGLKALLRGNVFTSKGKIIRYTIIYE